jgi:ribosomal protein L29
MKFSDIKNKSVAELNRELIQLRANLRDRRFKVAQGQHKDVREIRELKTDIARILTHLKALTISSTK